MPLARRIVMICAAAFGLFLLWFGLHVYAEFTEPRGNRAYAGTWMDAPASELLSVQGTPQQVSQRADGRAGNIYRYSFNGWRGMKGKVYPGTFLGTFVDDRRMHSRVLLVPARSGDYCDIDFITNEADIIEATAFSGNDCD